MPTSTLDELLESLALASYAPALRAQEVDLDTLCSVAAAQTRRDKAMAPRQALAIQNRTAR